MAGRIDRSRAGRHVGQRLGPVDRQVAGDVDVARLERVGQRRAVRVQLERQGVEARPLGPVLGRRRRRLCRCREGVGRDGRRCAAGRRAGALQDDLVVAQAREPERPVADRLRGRRRWSAVPRPGWRPGDGRERSAAWSRSGTTRAAVRGRSGPVSVRVARRSGRGMGCRRARRSRGAAGCAR